MEEVYQKNDLYEEIERYDLSKEETSSDCIKEKETCEANPVRQPQSILGLIVRFQTLNAFEKWVHDPY